MAKSKSPAGMGGMNMNAMLKQAQKMQSDIETARRELDDQEYEFSSGGGMVIARASGKNEIIGLEIKPEVIDPEDAEMLSDLVLLAVNGALKAARDDAEAAMSRISGGMDMPGLF